MNHSNGTYMHNYFNSRYKVIPWGRLLCLEGKVAYDEDELVPSLDIQEGVGLPSCDVVDDDEEGPVDIEALPHVEACSF